MSVIAVKSIFFFNTTMRAGSGAKRLYKDRILIEDTRQSRIAAHKKVKS